MSNRQTIVVFASSVAFLIPVLLSFAQVPATPTAPTFKIRRVVQQTLPAPDYRSLITGSGNSTSMNDRWLRIETEFDSTPEWADDVQLKYYVLLNNGRAARLLVGDVTYVNVPRGMGHYSGMFVHPNTLLRYGNGQAQAIGVQLLYKGQLVDQTSTPPTPDRWWERYTTTMSGFLLNPQQTPWSPISYSRYEALKPTP